jgi:hypothetical protein
MEVVDVYKGGPVDPMNFLYLDYGGDVDDVVDRPYRSNQSDGGGYNRETWATINGEILWHFRLHWTDTLL